MRASEANAVIGERHANSGAWNPLVIRANALQARAAGGDASESAPKDHELLDDETVQRAGSEYPRVPGRTVRDFIRSLRWPR